MSEVLEYRLKSIKVTIVLTASFLSVGLVPLWFQWQPLYGVIWFVFSAMMASIGLATKENGIPRKVWSVLYEPGDPPTDEWRENLEQRNAFEVSDYE